MTEPRKPAEAGVVNLLAGLFPGATDEGLEAAAEQVLAFSVDYLLSPIDARLDQLALRGDSSQRLAAGLSQVCDEAALWADPGLRRRSRQHRIGVHEALRLAGTLLGCEVEEWSCPNLDCVLVAAAGRVALVDLADSSWLVGAGDGLSGRFAAGERDGWPGNGDANLHPQT